MWHIFRVGFPFLTKNTFTKVAHLARIYEQSERQERTMNDDAGVEVTPEVGKTEFLVVQT
jgi:hypothetical protein